MYLVFYFLFSVCLSHIFSHTQFLAFVAALRCGCSSSVSSVFVWILLSTSVSEPSSGINSWMGRRSEANGCWPNLTINTVVKSEGGREVPELCPETWLNISARGEGTVANPCLRMYITEQYTLSVTKLMRNLIWANLFGSIRNAALQRQIMRQVHIWLLVYQEVVSHLKTYANCKTSRKQKLRG